MIELRPEISRKSISLAIICLGAAASARSCHASQDFGANPGECTIAIFNGSITSDGRPILWKNRDVSSFDQRFIYYSSYERDGILTAPFIGDAFRNDTARVFMGANAHGFAVVNSDSYNLGDSLSLGMDDGTLMRIALETCATVADFESLLDSTNAIGRLNCWNFGVLDSTGACVLYECANYSYIRFDSADPDYPTPNFIVRANFSLSGDNSRAGLERYKRGTDLILRQLEVGLIDVDFILSKLARDLANPFADPYPLPYNGSQCEGPPGYIYDCGGMTIANRSTASMVVIRGVLPGEDPGLATIFAMIGPPVLSVAFPLWVKSGNVPLYLSHPDGAPVYFYCTQRRLLLYDNPDYIFHLNSRYLLNDDGGGVFLYTLPLESWGSQQASFLLDAWHSQPPSGPEVQNEQFRIARAIFTGFQLETAEFVTDSGDVVGALPESASLSNYPNPFNQTTLIAYSGFDNGRQVVLEIYDVLGRLIHTMSASNSGNGQFNWPGIDFSGRNAVSGVYLYTVTCGDRRLSNKMTLLR